MAQNRDRKYRVSVPQTAGWVGHGTFMMLLAVKQGRVMATSAGTDR